MAAVAAPPAPIAGATTTTHPLPPRPNPQPTTDIHEPGPSSQPAPAAKDPPCSICLTQPSKYTCPGCHTRTCSLPCSKTHKTRGKGCNGVRNKAAYVPMGEYGWGAMMDDYVFLEDVGRKVVDWGKEIVRGSYGHGAGAGMNGASSMRGTGQGRGRGRGGAAGGGGARTKRDIFKMQMDIRDIDVELLPLEMKRRKANQSSWDFKKQTGLLTIELKFHRPRDPLAPTSTLEERPLVLLTHRNRMDKSLLTVLQTIVTERSTTSKKTSTGSASSSSSSPDWLRALIFPNEEDPEGFSPPHCVMSAPIDPLSIYASGFKPKKVWYKLDIHQPLAAALKNTVFVEFPTIEVWEEFCGAVLDPQGRVSLPEDQEPEMKRRRLNKKAAKERINGLLGGYGSGDDSEGKNDDEEDEKRNVMSLLGEYSDDEEEGEGKMETMSDNEDDEEAEKELEPAALMELLRQVRGEHWTAPDVGGDDVLEWGDLSDADAEGEDDPGDEEEMG